MEDFSRTQPPDCKDKLHHLKAERVFGLKILKIKGAVGHEY